MFETEELLLEIVKFKENSDFNYLARKAAVLGLVTLQSARSVNVLKSVRSNFVNQDQPWLTRRINDIENSSKQNKIDLENEIQSLKLSLDLLEKQF